MSELTTTQEVREAYQASDDGVDFTRRFNERGDEFDRWLSGVLADAWDEGHRTYQKREPDECYCSAWSEGECACGLYGTGKIITPNPYRRTE